MNPSADTLNKAPSSSDEGSLEGNAESNWMNPGTYSTKAEASCKAPPPWSDTIPGSDTVATGARQATNVTLDDVDSVLQRDHNGPALESAPSFLDKSRYFVSKDVIEG